METTIVILLAGCVFVGFLYAIFKDNGNNHPGGTNSSDEQISVEDINS